MKRGCLWLLGAWLAPVAAHPLLLCAEPWYPFVYQEEGQVRGLLANALQRLPDVSVHYRFMSLSGCQKLMKQDKVDMVAFAAGKHAPAGWLTTRQTLVSWVLYAWVPATSQDSHFDAAQFGNRRLAWVNAYDYPFSVQNDHRYQRVEALDADEAVSLLARGRVDLILDDPFLTQGIDPDLANGIRRLPEVVAMRPQPLALRPGLAALRDRIDREIQKMRSDGSLDAFYQFHFGSSLTTLMGKLPS
ncbi:hypothetical protein THUN1379_07960 [Paludibacterium sp. THUN1379]|uniref:substrate-binding periplasmic protein n=1 Tax=Paludibacterium sp. THUN1379 TaxID=3112107 RepID=UPI003092662C|nr:hypothetical protein THUN1379_07960 [Paludibacterium sp. THUN1379]